MQPLTTATLAAYGSFGALLRAQRRRACLSQGELATRSGLSERTVRNLEANRVQVPRASTARMLAEALGLAAPERELFVSVSRGELTTQEPAGTISAPGVGGPAPLPGDVPAQLPLDVHSFVGRDDQLARLDSILAMAGEQPTAVVVSAVSGTAGVGKTALAVHWAHQVAEQFGDGQLYVNLRGFDPTGSTMSPAEAVRGFLDAFGVPPRRVPASLEARAALYRSLLAGKRVLVLLDNARGADQVRPLLPGAPGCLAVVTSRNQLTGLVAVEGAHPLTLDLLTRDEAQQLLARRLGVDRLAAEPRAVDEIIARCARLPLALAIVAARATIHPALPLTTLAAELHRTQGVLDAFAGDDATSDVRAVSSWSYHALDVEAARLFRLLGLHPGPDLPLRAAASLAGAPAAAARRWMAELTRAHLVAEHTPDRYALHDLLRVYAAELAHTLDSEADRRAAVHRVLDHYLHTALHAALLVEPHRAPITPVPPQPGVTAANLLDHEQAITWFTAEHFVLLAAIDQAARHGFDTHTWQLAWTLENFFDRRGHWHDLAATQHTALRAARRLADLPGQAHTHDGLARAYAQLGRYGDAHTHLEHALALFDDLGDHTAQARTHQIIGCVFGRQGRHREALSHAGQALDLSQAAGDRHGQANALNAVGWCHAQLGEYQQALTPCQQALPLLQELGDRHGQADTWDSLGYAHHYLGHHHQAITCYQHALKLYRRLGDRYLEAVTLSHLGDTHCAAGDPGAGRQAWQRAVDILDNLSHPDTDQVAAKLHQLDSNQIGDRGPIPGR